jgi:hypothetical protein
LVPRLQGLDGIPAPAPGQVGRWPTDPSPLINPLREPDRWNAYVARERLQNPELYKTLDRLNADRKSSLTLPEDADLSLLFQEEEPSYTELRAKYPQVRAYLDAQADIRKFGRGNIQVPQKDDERFLLYNTQQLAEYDAAETLRRYAPNSGMRAPTPGEEKQMLELMFGK